MITEQISICGQEHTIEVKPITLVFKAPNVIQDIETPERVMIDAFMTHAHTAEVIRLHPRTERLFKLVFPAYAKEFTANDIRQEGSGMKHVLGLIDLSLIHLDANKKFGWRYPEAYLHPAAQAALADVLIAMLGNDQIKLLDILL